mgnify:CR=1 FL=1
MKIARDYRLELGIQEGDAKFLAEHGEELFALTARMTRLNDGVASSATSEKYGGGFALCALSKHAQCQCMEEITTN